MIEILRALIAAFVLTFTFFGIPILLYLKMETMSHDEHIKFIKKLNRENERGSK